MQTLPRVLQILRQIVRQRSDGRRPTVVRFSFLDPLLAVVALSTGHTPIVEIDRARALSERQGFDLDAVTEEDLTLPARPVSPVTMDDLDRVIGSSDLMPPGTDIQPLAPREYGLLAPGMTERLRVTTDPEYFEEHAGSVELWSLGNPLFNPPDFLTSAEESASAKTLKDLLER